MLFSLINYKSVALAEEAYVASDGIVENQEYPETSSINSEVLPIEATEEPISGNMEIDQSKVLPIEYMYGNTNERIFGKDQRKVVDNYLSSPYKQVVLLNMTFSDGNVYSGSGTMIGEDTVLTAAHNVYSSKLGWAAEVTVYAGKKGSKYTIGKAKSKKILTFKKWKDSSNQDYDLAIIKLDSKLGKKTGTLGLTSKISKDEEIETSGFPGDKSGEVQYKSNGNLKKITDNILYYYLDTFFGQSGSSVRNKQNKIIAVHTFGASDYNGGVRLNALKIDYIKHWMGTPVAHHFGKFVQIDKKNIKLWSNLEFSMSKDSKKIKKGDAYEAKYVYNHPNGQKYYSLYNSENKWVGYINSQFVTFLKAPNAHKYNKNIIINKGKFAVWRSLDFSKKADLKNIKFGKEYTAKYEYYHPNGQKYFSLYDNKNKWMGYINTRSVTVKK